MIYLASPYSHPDKSVMQQRYIDTMTACKHLIFDKGLVVFSPIVYTHEMAQLHDLPTDAASWDYFNRGMLSKCDRMIVLMLDGWEKSQGVQSEIAWAVTNGFDVQYLTSQQCLLPETQE